MGNYKLVATAIDVNEQIHLQQVELIVRFNANANLLRNAKRENFR